MPFAKNFSGDTANALCTACGIPVEAQYFDESGIANLPGPGESVVLAHFDLHPQYRGVLNYFVQFTDLFGKDNSQIETPGLEWLLLINNRPLFPYLKLDRILNPWGCSSFPIAIRLDENAKVEFVVRNVGGSAITKVGGRIMGRYWFNADYGNLARKGL